MTTPNATINGQYEVRPFGRDCLGNISGYYVRGPQGENMGQYVADIYERGSRVLAKRAADILAAGLNDGTYPAN